VIVFENLRLALQSLVANPLRSLLTLVGIAVGIAAVLHVVSLGQLTQQRVRERLDKLGTNVLSIRPGVSRVRGVHTDDVVTTFTRSDVEEIERESEAIALVAPTYSGGASAEFRDRNWPTRITGTTPAYFPINNEALALGRFFDDGEVKRRSRVAVLGDTVWRELFDGRDPLGAKILIQSQRFAVVGVLEAKGEGWANPDDQIYIPLTTAQERLFGVDHLSMALAQMRSEIDFEEALFDIETILRHSHRLRPDDENDFRVFRQDFFLATIRDANRDIARFVVAIALISLFVGGLGIANMMLVSVTERTREIGIRRALGASRSHVLLQFLTEAAVLGLAGGTVGIGAGFVSVRWLLGSHAGLPWTWVGNSFAICAAIGLVAGMYPAIRAARSDVIEALRYE